MCQWIIRSKLLMRRWLPTVLIASLILNFLLIGGFLYQRFIVQPRLQSEWAVRTLHLDEHQQADLQKLDAWARDRIKQMIGELAPEIAAARQGLREGRADDPALQVAMRRLSERRLALQMESLAHVIAFRDTLSPEQRQIFSALSERREFVPQLLGLVPQSKQQTP